MASHNNATQISNINFVPNQIFSAEEAVSSMEIDSSANDLTNHKALITSPDSYVSTTIEPTEPASHAQMLEELRARIRELEGSPLKMRGHDEEHYKCYICKVGFSIHPCTFKCRTVAVI